MLITLPDGSHRSVPAPENLRQDLDYMLGQRRAGRVDGRVEPPRYIEIDLGEGLTYYRWELVDGRGNIIQDGTFEENGNDFSDGDLIWDKAHLGRNSYSTSRVTSPLMTGAYGGRLSGDEFLGVPLMIGADDVLYRDDGALIPSISAVAGFSPPAGASYAMCCLTVQIGGAPWFAIGWNSATVNALQILSNLNNPPTSSTIPVGGFEVSGLCQTPIDGDALQIYTCDATGGLIKRIGMVPAAGTVLPEDAVRLPRGGYTVGMVALDGSPDVFYAVPADGQWLVASAAGGPWTFPNKLKLVRTDLRASFGPQLVKIQLPWVRWATAGANSIFYCAGGREHRFMTRGSDIPVPGTDRAPETSGNIKIECVGHHVYGDKFFWTEQYVDQSSVLNTTQRRFEYDAALNRAWPVMPKEDTGGTGIRGMGGARLPISLTSSTLLEYSVGGWPYQFQPPTGDLATQYMHVDGAGSSSGRMFAHSSTRTTPRLRPAGHHNPFMTMARLTGPTASSLRRGAASQLTAAGIAEGTNPAQVKLQVTGSGLQETVEWTGADAQYTEDHRLVYVNPVKDDWVPFVQLTLASIRGIAGANATQYSPVVDRFTVEGYIYDRPMPAVGADHEKWGAYTEVANATEPVR